MPLQFITYSISYCRIISLQIIPSYVAIIGKCHITHPQHAFSMQCLRQISQGDAGLLEVGWEIGSQLGRFAGQGRPDWGGQGKLQGEEQGEKQRIRSLADSKGREWKRKLLTFQGTSHCQGPWLGDLRTEPPDVYHHPVQETETSSRGKTCAGWSD